MTTRGPPFTLVRVGVRVRVRVKVIIIRVRVRVRVTPAGGRPSLAHHTRVPGFGIGLGS